MLNTSRVQIIFCLLCLLNKFEIALSDNTLLGPADVSLTDQLQCETSGMYKSSFVFERKKFNRTTEVFDGNLTLDVDFDESVGIYINVAKWGDGGYKPNYVLYNESSACYFFMTRLHSGFRQILSGAGLPVSCPMKKGVIPVKGYALNYRDLPDEMVYGKFRAVVTMAKKGQVVMCYVWFVESKMKNILG